MGFRASSCAAAVAVVLGLAACGGSAGSHTGGSGSGGSHTAAGAPSASGSRSGPVSGREVFTRDCLYCHSLSGHSRPSQQGGDLRNVHASRRQLWQLTAEMPVLHQPLTQAELNAVVDYVMEVERRASGG